MHQTGATRRAFLKAAAAAALAGRARPANAQPTALHNGIVLPRPWPPRRASLPADPVRPPYLASPPAVIPIDCGRQLFVDDFLIEESGLCRTFHRAEYHAASPVLVPARAWEERDPHADLTGTPRSPAAMVFSDGVFFDPADRVFKMWYMAGYQQQTAMAVSHDGIAWDRPVFDVVTGTNVVSTFARDSTTVWLDHAAPSRSERFKLAGYDMDARRLRLQVSPDGVHWRDAGWSGPSRDRSTMFLNPFLDRWVFSLRRDIDGGLNRVRTYLERRSFVAEPWSDDTPVEWAGADSADLRREDLGTRPQLYNLDATPYESVLLGLWTMFRGERPDREKPNDLCVAFSRDGFHWSRDSREAFLTVSERQGDWNWSNVQSAGGVCLVVGDRLHFYVSGRQGIAGTQLPGVCCTGLATLRRDGFASLSDTWPTGEPRLVSRAARTITTRPVRFSGTHLFVNADIDGDVRVEVLDRAGRPIEPFTLAGAEPITGNGTRLPARWKGAATLAQVAGEPVRFRFTLSRARLYAFWVSPSPGGQSRGYVAAGGPGLPGAIDE